MKQTEYRREWGLIRRRRVIAIGLLHHYTCVRHLTSYESPSVVNIYALSSPPDVTLNSVNFASTAVTPRRQLVPPHI